MNSLRHGNHDSSVPGVWRWAIVVLALIGAGTLGSRASERWLVLLSLGMGVFVLVQRPVLGLFALAPAGLIVPTEIPVGSEVTLNAVTILVPSLAGVWFLDMIRRREMHFVTSRVNRPLLLFLVTSILSLAIGITTWDPAVPRAASFTVVQLAQWAIFAFSATAMWLTANLIQDTVWLRRLTFSFLGLGGVLAIWRVSPARSLLVGSVGTIGLETSTFWMVLTALAGGQLLFNRELSRGWRVLLGATLIAAALFVFTERRETVANWVGVTAVGGVLVWLRWPCLRRPVILLLLILTVTGIVSSAVYDFAGGDDAWAESGASRLVLIERVIKVSLRNPITGLGPAAYRLYAGVEPLRYGRAYWVAPQISSHNNYVDLFSHVGLVGLALVGWFATEVARLGLRLRAHFRRGFAAGYVNGTLAVGAGALVLMLLVDTILPFVYNYGFRGFKSSVLVWLFLGGLVSLDTVKRRSEVTERDGNAA